MSEQYSEISEYPVNISSRRLAFLEVENKALKEELEIYKDIINKKLKRSTTRGLLIHQKVHELFPTVKFFCDKDALKKCLSQDENKKKEYERFLKLINEPKKPVETQTEYVNIGDELNNLSSINENKIIVDDYFT
jgi:heme oxygenase